MKENDKFNFELGDNRIITHVPSALGTDRGATIGAYAIGTLEDGTKVREVMDMEELEKARKASKNADSGPWKVWPDEMRKKTVIHRLFKRLPRDSGKFRY